MFVGGSKDISEYHFGRKIGESMQLKAEKTLIAFFSPARVQVFLAAHYAAIGFQLLLHGLP